jgi:hypothetical protein
MATYLEKQNLALEADFQKRVTFAIAKYAQYVAATTSSTEPNYFQTVTWARRTLINPNELLYKIMPALLQEAQIDVDLGAITDANLQSAVESVINTNLFWVNL